MIPLAYVTRETIAVDATILDLANNKPRSTLHGSVEGDLIARASHDHALYREDNAKVYYFIEEATRSTSYLASIMPFQCTKNGRGAVLVLKAQYADVDKWESEIKCQESLLHTWYWKG